VLPDPVQKKGPQNDANIDEASSSNTRNLPRTSNSEQVEPKIRLELGHLHFTADELISVEIATKLAGGESDASFERHIQNFVTGLTHPDDLKALAEDGTILEPELQKLPGSRHKSNSVLKKTGVVPVKYRIYCDKCLTICGCSYQRPLKATCINEKCKKDLSAELKKGNCLFVTMSIKEQLKRYLQDKRFRKLLRAYKPMKWAQLQGTIHRGIIESGDFDLSMGIDGGQMHNKIGITVLPAVIFINNLPCSWQMRYPILAAVWTGKSQHEPDRAVFLKMMQEELRELETEPFAWKDDTGEEHMSKVFLTMCISDGPEKSVLLNQKGHSGYYSCPFCKIPGTEITKENFRNVFIDNPQKRTLGDTTVGGGPRFPKFIHEEYWPWRDDEDRLDKGLEVIEEIKARRDPNYSDEGIKGLPALHTMDRFEETGSHVCDTLHTICIGICSDILATMINGGSSNPNAFCYWGGTFDPYIKMQDSMTRVSESNRNPYHLNVYNTEWKAYDRYQFLIHQVALLCSDEGLYTATDVYECLIHLSNIVFYCHYGRLTEEIIDRVETEIAKFSEAFRTIFTEEFCTYKMHMLQHFPDQLRKHGPAYYTDGFNLERFISQCKKLTTTNKLHMKQLARNFLLKFHNEHFKDMEHFGPHAKLALKANGISDEFFWEFEDKVLKKKGDQSKPRVSSLFTYAYEFVQTLDFVKETPIGFQEIWDSSVRVEKMNRKCVVLETKDAYHPQGSRVRDSLIQVQGEVFGQIHEILHFPQQDKFVVIMNKFFKIHPLDKENARILYPDNQFPFREPIFPDYCAFLLEDETFILKAQVGVTSYSDTGFPVQIFTVRANEQFRF